LWGSEIHINLKIDADAGVAFVSAEKYISITVNEGSMLVIAHASALDAV
jgi:hypothetical protein